MSEKLTKEEYLNMLQCVRCGSIENLKPYKLSSYQRTSYKSTRRYTRETGITYTNEFPVCEICVNRFKRYKRISNISSAILTVGILTAFFGIIAMIITIHTIYRIPSFVSIIIGIIITVIGGIMLGKNRTSTDKAKKYMDISFGMPRIKPENSEKWFPFQAWAEYVSKDRILKGNLDPSLQIKVAKIVETNIQKDIKEQERVSSIVPCPECGNLNDLSVRNTCEICGSAYKN